MKEKVFDLTKKKKWFVLILLMISGGLIYNLPYFRSTFYTPLQEALGLAGQHGKYGFIISVYGLLSIIFYIPGGWIADTFSTRKLLSGSLVATGLLGFWFATWPSYNVVLVIMALWAITTVLTYWSAFIKIINLLSETSAETAENYGYIEGGGGIVQVLLLLLGLGGFSVLGATSTSLSIIMISYSVILILTGVLLYLILPEPAGGKDRISAKDTLKGMFSVMKMPITYILAVIIFGCFFVYSGANYFIPYLEHCFFLSAAMAGTINVLRINGVRIFAGPVFGYGAKRLGRSTGLIKWSFVACIILLGILFLLPLVPWLLISAICIIFLLGFFLCGIRAVYWSIIEDMETPAAAIGSVVGFASLIGFLPDVFLYAWFGNIIDSNPVETAYSLIFGIMLIALVITGAITFVVDHIVMKKKRAHAN